MKTLTRTVIALFILMSSLAGLPGNSLANQTEQKSTWISESTGATLDIGDSGDAYIDRDYDFYGEVADGSIVEGTWLQKGNSEIGITFLTTDRDQDQIVQNYIEVDKDERLLHYTILGQVSDTTNTWHLAEYAQYHGQFYYEYQHFEWDFGGDYHILIEAFSHHDNISSDIEWLQENVTIDDTPILANADLTEVNNLLGNTSNLESWEVDPFSSDVADWSDQGLVSESEWNDAQFDSTVTWDTTHLRFPFESQVAIEFIEENESSTLSLTSPDNGGNILVTTMTNPEGRTISGWRERWSSKDMVTSTQNLWPAVGIKETDTSVGVILTKQPRYDLELVTIRQGVLTPEDTMLMLTIVVPPDQAVAVYSDVINHLQINGNTIAPVWTTEELQEYFPASESESNEITRTSRSAQDPASTPETQPERTSRSSRPDSSPDADTQDWNALGLVSDSEWQSPNSDTVITWDTSLIVFAREEPDAISTGDTQSSVTLTTTNQPGVVTVITNTSGMSIEELYAEVALDEEFASPEPSDAPFVLVDSYSDDTTAGVILMQPTESGSIIVIIDHYMNDDGVAIITSVIAHEDDIADVYSDFWNGVQSDGEYYPLTWTLEDIENLEIN